MPDIEDRFWKKYREQGLVVVALNPGGRGGVSGGASTDDMAGVQKFCAKLGITYPAGMEETRNYGAFAANFKGLNPFPIDVVVGKDGTIVHVSREYDPDKLTEVIESELKK